MSFHFVRELPTPAVVKEMHPVPTELAEIKKERDRMISDIILGKDDRFLVIIGPCSADREDAVCEYVSRLAPIQEKVILPVPAENSKPSWFGFLISVKPEAGVDRDTVTKYIEEHNIQTRLLFSGNLIKHPCFDQIRDTDAYRVVGSLNHSEFIMKNTFWVGVYPGMTDMMIDYMVQVIIEAVNQKEYL